MSTTICFDFGNTRLKAALFEQDQLKEIVILSGASVPQDHLMPLNVAPIASGNSAASMRNICTK